MSRPCEEGLRLFESIDAHLAALSEATRSYPPPWLAIFLGSLTEIGRDVCCQSPLPDKAIYLHRCRDGTVRCIQTTTLEKRR